MPRFLSAVVALPIALVFVIVAASPVAAIQSLKTSGSVGHWSFDETVDSPRVTCNYGPEVAPDDSFTTSIKVKPPTVFAADRNSAKRDSRKVSWQFQLQHKQFPDGNWIDGAKSAVQKATAYDNKAAPFTTLTLKHDGRKDPVDALRLKVTIKWYKPSGSVEGKVSFGPTYYRLITPFGTFTGGGPYCEADQTAG